MESHIGGSIILTKMAEKRLGSLVTMGDAPEAKERHMSEKTAEIMQGESDNLITLVHLENTDEEKCGSLLKTLNQQLSLNDNQFPKRIRAAMEISSTHCFDNARKLGKRGKKKHKMTMMMWWDYHAQRQEENVVSVEEPIN